MKLNLPAGQVAAAKLLKVQPPGKLPMPTMAENWIGKILEIVTLTETLDGDGERPCPLTQKKD